MRRLSAVLLSLLAGCAGLRTGPCPDDRGAPDVVDHYDCVILDAHGGAGALEDAVALAADLLISPVRPDVLSGSEFMDGTLRMLERLDASSAIGAGLGPMKAVINCLRRSNNSRLVADTIRENFIRAQGRVTMLDTVIPDANAYQAAATAQVPVHRFDRQRGAASPSAYEVMHRLAWELIPSLPAENIIAEPTKRDTGPAIALGIGWVAARDPGATMMVLPADHLIQDTAAFQSVLLGAAEAAEAGKALVTVGINPTWACPS